MRVKIADFGRGRSLNYAEYYTQSSEAPTPIRWMAPEALIDGKFTFESDVWSFGVVLWEIVTWGQMPYPGLSNVEVLERVRNHYRMEQVCPFGRSLCVGVWVLR